MDQQSEICKETRCLTSKLAKIGVSYKKTCTSNELLKFMNQLADNKGS